MTKVLHRKACDSGEAHVPHEWGAHESEYNPGQVIAYQCPGVPDDSVTPADILTMPTEEPDIEDEDVQVIYTMPTAQEVREHLDTIEQSEVFSRYMYSAAHSAWVCNECSSLVLMAVDHDAWHKDLQRMLEKP